MNYFNISKSYQHNVVPRFVSVYFWSRVFKIWKVNWTILLIKTWLHVKVLLKYGFFEAPYNHIIMFWSKYSICINLFLQSLVKFVLICSWWSSQCGVLLFLENVFLRCDFNMHNLPPHCEPIIKPNFLIFLQQILTTCSCLAQLQQFPSCTQNFCWNNKNNIEKEENVS